MEGVVKGRTTSWTKQSDLSSSKVTEHARLFAIMRMLPYQTMTLTTWHCIVNIRHSSLLVTSSCGDTRSGDRLGRWLVNIKESCHLIVSSISTIRTSGCVLHASANQAACGKTTLATRQTY